jgi:hypothetical protein
MTTVLHRFHGNTRAKLKIAFGGTPVLIDRVD